MNATLTSLVNDVYTLTNRPDLVGETLLAVKNATLKAHGQDFFPKDLFETGISFEFSLSQQSLDYRTLVPNWRALKYLRKYYPDDNGGTPGAMLDVITPDQIFDSYNFQRANVCYMAGAEIKLRSQEPCQYYLLGCYVHPNVTEDGYNSWIAQEQSAAIVYQAAATVFKTIGYDEQNATYMRMVAEEYAELIKNNILAVGY